MPASRLLLAAACPGLKPQLSPSGSVALHWPEVSPKVAKAIVETCFVNGTGTRDEKMYYDERVEQVLKICF